MKRFKRSFGVQGSPAQIAAFKEAAEEMGWKFNLNVTEYSQECLFMCGLGSEDLFGPSKINTFWKPKEVGFGCYSCYQLPAQWSEAMAAASECEVEPKPTFKRGDTVMGELSRAIVLFDKYDTDRHYFCGQVLVTDGGALVKGEYLKSFRTAAFTLHTDPVTI